MAFAKSVTIPAMAFFLRWRKTDAALRTRMQALLDRIPGGGTQEFILLVLTKGVEALEAEAARAQQFPSPQ